MKNTKLIILFTVIVGAFLLFKFSKKEKHNTSPVKNFVPEKYLGKWFEIARFDHIFERNLAQVTANYSLLPDGRIKIVNSGVKLKSKEKKTAEGIAYSAGQANVGHLKVSFFWPFSSDYYVLDLDSNYQWALVGSSSKKYFWILSRTPKISLELKDSLLKKMSLLGYDEKNLIWVEQE